MKKLLQWLSEQVEHLDPDRAWEEIQLVLLDDASMAELNQKTFGKEHPTDVISYGYEPVPGAETGRSGDVFVNVDRAVQVGEEHGGMSRELALYAAHGCHHLAGANDATDEERAAMRRQEEAWLDAAGRLGLLEDLVEGEPTTRK